MAEKKETELIAAIPVDGIEFQNRRKEAITRLTKGMTPQKDIKSRPGRGGSSQRYVDISYMVEQANLLTAFNWKQEIVREEEYKDKDGKVLEIGALVRVTFFLPNGTAISKEQWGQKDVMYNDKTGRPLAYFDDKKAAISDGVKKCLSYFGIAADVYAGKEIEFYMDDPEYLDSMGNDEWQNAFTKLVAKYKLPYNKVFEVLKVKSLTDITDYRKAYEDLKKYLEEE